LRTEKVMTGKLQSMSDRSNCYDNAVFEFIEMFYNRKRLHSYLNYSSPEQFEKSYYYERFGECA